MLAEKVTDGLFAALDRPDLQSLSDRISLDLSPRLDLPFTASADAIILGALAFERPEMAPTLLRYGLEWVFLLQDLPAQDRPLAAIVAARVAALFHQLDSEIVALPAGLAWLHEFAAHRPPCASRVTALWPELIRFCPGLSITGVDPAPLLARLEPLWLSLGPAEYLMADGGDERLTIDPKTGLNRYGCSHRPRPWAVTFSSSTASSLSERGYLGAERARRSFLLDALGGTPAPRAREAACLNVRQGLAALYGLESRDNIVLAASGTDCELAVLAIGLMRAGGRSAAITNILIAPDETGSGVPLAAQGRHFAAGTALGNEADKASHLEGFPTGTRLLGIAIRNPDGSPRDPGALDEEVRCCVMQELTQGRHVILHQLDMSKTGLVGPRHDLLQELIALYPGQITLVVDACQARLAPERVAAMVRSGMLVMTTGSKFLTGPPFCGAVLLPDELASSLASFSLPEGLSAYFNRCDWPQTSSPDPLMQEGNLGLALRWQAALAESKALAAVPRGRITETLRRFEKAAREVIANHPSLTLLSVPPLERASMAGQEIWDTVPTVFSFLVNDPQAQEKPLSLERARALHRWLNADLSPWIRGSDLAELLCQLGQPVPVPHPALGGDNAGALRLCAGARLVSGEPSHAGLTNQSRLDREFADIRRVFAKISLILTHWKQLEAVDPVPRYAPHSHFSRKSQVS
ncbi:hypothetical protein [Asaia prunellae]|uniref:hypothetical protein n=1 Tax=Asaia prunellae TaxID=610245 RepID=UPI0004723FCB|nr:hypothetical protein [Asaia prunellae]